MSHSLQDEIKRGQIEKAIGAADSAPDFETYFKVIRKFEAESLSDPAFYEKLQELLEAAPPDNRLFALEKQRADYLRRRLQNRPEANLLGLQWLKVCRDLKNSDGALFFLLGGGDREEEIKCELYPAETSSLRPYYSTAIGRLYLPALLNFFLRVYNLPEAFRLAKEISCAPKRRDNSRKPAAHSPRLSAGLGLSLLALILLLLGAVKIPLFAVASWENWFHQLASAWPSWTPDWAQFNGGTTALAGIYLSLSLALPLALFSRLHILFRLLLPRLIGGIVVGYMVLIFSNDVWNMVDRLGTAAIYPANGLVIILLAIGLAFFFLLNEVRQTIRQTGVALTRSALILLMGILEALLIGVVLADLFGLGMAPASDPGIPGLFGKLYPSFIAISAPLALLIGIFVQIIWEDKPITEPF